MEKDFYQISSKQGFMKHNGGLWFRDISKNDYQFKTVINENHLNAAGITHGGFIASIIDAGAGTAAHKASEQRSCVTISLDIKFIKATSLKDEVIGFVKIQKITKTMVFLICHLECNGNLIASGSEIGRAHV